MQPRAQLEAVSFLGVVCADAVKENDSARIRVNSVFMLGVGFRVLSAGCWV